MKATITGNIVGCIVSLLVLQALLLVSSLVKANDTISADTSYEIRSERDTLHCGDSIIVIHTVCAPICSSHARVYNKEWQEIGELTPTVKTAFPEAYIEDGRVLWRDNDTYDYTPAY